MNKKNRTLRLTKGIMAYAVVMAFLLLGGIVAGANNPINVPFIPQSPPGDWKNPPTQNCGQASSLMVYSYYDGTAPTAQGIKDIDDWLYNKYGSSQAINSYSGSSTTTTILETLAKEYGSKYGSFPYSYKTSGWTVARVKQEIDAGAIL